MRRPKVARMEDLFGGMLLSLRAWERTFEVGAVGSSGHGSS